MAYIFNGDRRRFEAFTRRHHPSMIRIARRICGEGGIDPEDLVQETLERALRNFDKLAPAGESACSAWLSTTLTNRFLDHCRRRRTEVMGRPGLKVVQDLVVLPEGEPAERWELVSEEEFLAAIARLKPTLREAYQLHASGLRYREIAAKFNVPEGTVGSWLFQARKELKEMLVRPEGTTIP